MNDIVLLLLNKFYRKKYVFMYFNIVIKFYFMVWLDLFYFFILLINYMF